ncbi:hypothetical protein JRO89_XS12G0238200 [Xanthoceras sorbifolium]|uniref:Ribosomal protein L34e superfamily protein n=1 Tax=Xanthoceras sorbifolium TaxID=99658 RepID=A0ABQ8HDL1_9ROSI|nr:hypothetical protein JRO89_XS12G0238200 [Xanthoceras sorbifolium]
MANSLNSNSRQSNQLHRNNNKRTAPSSPNGLKTPSCCDRSTTRSASAAVDVIILIAVVSACGFLLFPYFKTVSVNSIQVSAAVFHLVKLELVGNPIVYGSIAISVSCVTVAAWVVLLCTTRKCGNPNCKGLRKAAEFDIQLETEECVKNSSPSVKDGSGGGGGGGGVKRGLFELPRDHHRELEAELKKMAPPNGRAVLIFRARCGCSVGRLEVPGPKKQRKIKK